VLLGTFTWYANSILPNGAARAASDCWMALRYAAGWSVVNSRGL
jgi:hypothetical protein